MHKICKICALNKPVTEFQKREYGKHTYRPYCLACWSARNKAKYNDNKKFRDDAKSRAQNYRDKHKNTPAYKATKRRDIYKYNAENKEKQAARVSVRLAVEAGRLNKPEICECCGDGGVIHGHHSDYNYPLVVVWLCVACHGLEHRL